MTASRKTTGRWPAVTLLAVLALMLAGCGGDTSGGASGEGQAETSTEINGSLTIGAIPDQDPEQLARTYGLVADYLEGAVPGLTVEYLPVTDYQGAVAVFRGRRVECRRPARHRRPVHERVHREHVGRDRTVG